MIEMDFYRHGQAASGQPGAPSTVGVSDNRYKTANGFDEAREYHASPDVTAQQVNLTMQSFAYGGGTDFTGNTVSIPTPSTFGPLGGFASVFSLYDSTGVLVAGNFTFNGTQSFNMGTGSVTLGANVVLDAQASTLRSTGTPPTRASIQTQSLPRNASRASMSSLFSPTPRWNR